MKHLEIVLNCVGDEITAISAATKIVKTSGEASIRLNFSDGESIMVHAESYTQDLIQVRNYQMRLKREEAKSKK